MTQVVITWYWPILPFLDKFRLVFICIFLGKKVPKLKLNSRHFQLVLSHPVKHEQRQFIQFIGVFFNFQKFEMNSEIGQNSQKIQFIGVFFNFQKFIISSKFNLFGFFLNVPNCPFFHFLTSSDLSFCIVSLKKCQNSIYLEFCFEKNRAET